MPATPSGRCWCWMVLSLASVLIASRSIAAEGGSLAGTYRDQRLAITLEKDAAAADSYGGSIQMNGQTYPVKARANGNTLEGTFSDAAGNPFPFTAKLEGGALTLTTGSTTYQLAAAGNVAPAAPGNPLAPAAGNGQPVPAPARRHEYKVTPNSSTLLLMPELQNAPPPDWVKPGLRIVTYQADASIPGGRQVLVQDPDGTLRNVATGQTFSLQENTGGSGHGFSVVDVVAVLPDAVVAEVKSYLLMDVNNLITFSGSFGFVTTPSCAGDLWIHPAVLGKYLDLNGQGIRSFRTPYKAAGKTYNALWRSITGEGGTTLVYDIDSGLKLHTALSAFQDAHTAVINGKSQMVGGMTNLSQMTLAGIRQVDTPWTKGRLPKVLEGLRQLTYEGTSTTFIPGAPLMPSPLRSVITITGRGDDFLQAERTGVMMIGNMRNDLGKVELVSGPAQLMPFAIDPADLARLRQGQVLDEDPATKEVVKVSFIGRDKRGQNVVMITSEFPAAQGAQEHQRTDAVYDRASGLMVSAGFNNPFLHIQTQVSLKSKQ